MNPDNPDNPDNPEGLKVLFFYLAVHLPALEATELDASTLDPAEGWRHDGAIAVLCAMSEGDLIEEVDRLHFANVPAEALYVGLEDGLRNGFLQTPTEHERLTPWLEVRRTAAGSWLTHPMSGRQ